MIVSRRKRELLCKAVVERDDGLCQRCGRQGADIHHIVPRSRASRYSARTWRVENMVCLCLGCHGKAQTTAVRLELLKTMQTRYGYPMDWPRELGVSLEA